MKQNKLKTVIRILALVALLTYEHFAVAQLTPQMPVGVTIGQPFTLNGQTFIVTTNAAGNYVVITSGPAGTVTNTPPTTLQGFLDRAQEIISANNPANKGYYTNELEFQVGAVYAQNSGQAAAKLSIEKWGLLTPNLGFGAAVLEGNANGQHATAAGVGFVDYRKVIGDVAGKIGLFAGYDNLNASPVFGPQAEVEYRMTQHLGTYVGVGFGIEKRGKTKGSAEGGGMLIGGGISYAF